MYPRAWFIATTETVTACGGCRAPFKPDAPFQRLEVSVGHYLYRCAECALGGRDDAAIAQAREDVRAREERAAIEAEAPVSVGTRQPVLPLKPARPIAERFDSKAAAAGRDDE